MQPTKTFHGAVLGGAGHAVGDHLAIAHDQVRSDDHADVVHFEALAGVDAAHLLHRLFGHDPEAAVLLQVPLGVEVRAREADVRHQGILLAHPVPAVACHHPRLVVGAVECVDVVSQVAGAVEHPEVELVG